MKVKPLGQRSWQRNISLLGGYLKRAGIAHVHESGLLARKEDLFMSKVWSVKNGLQVNLWLDFWLPNGTLRILIEGPLTRYEDKVMLHQCFDIGTGWNLQNSSIVLPNQVLESMKGTPFSCDTNSEDSLIWAYSKDGSFSLSSAYLLAQGLNSLNLDIVSLSWVWKTTTLPQVQFFI